MKNKFKVLFIYPNSMMVTLLPVHISQLSACLKKNNFQVELFDTTYYPTEKAGFEEKKVELLQLKPFNLKDYGIVFKKNNIYDDLKKKILQYKPDLIGISLVQDTAALGCKLLKFVRQCSSTPIIAGGVYAYWSAEELLEKDYIDMVCVGEGEGAIVELCQKMETNQDITNIDNIWVKKGKEIIKNKVRPLCDINNNPFIDYSIFEKNRVGRPMFGKIFSMIHVEIDRGCSYNCTYCGAPSIRKYYKDNTSGRYYRQKRIDRILDEMKYLKEKYSPNYIDFDAESFLTRSVKQLELFAKRYKKEINLPFWCQSRPEDVTREKLKIIKDMGCADMQYGIEHGNQEFRKKMLNRDVSNERMLEGCHLTEEAGIPYTVNNIIGFPHETRELVWDTINFNRQIKPKTANCYLFTPYKGTWLYKYCVENDFIDVNSETFQLLDGADIRYDKINKEELYGLQRTFCLYSILDESKFPMIKKAEKFNEEGNAAFCELKKEFYKVMNWKINI